MAYRSEAGVFDPYLFLQKDGLVHRDLKLLRKDDLVSVAAELDVDQSGTKTVLIETIAENLELLTSAQIAERDSQLAERDAQLAERDAQMKEQARRARLEVELGLKWRSDKLN